MEGAVILSIFSAIVTCAVLYFVIKAAVRDGIIEAWEHRGKTEKNEPEREGEHIAKVICPGCGNGYDMDYPRCPFCEAGR